MEIESFNINMQTTNSNIKTHESSVTANLLTQNQSESNQINNKKSIAVTDVSHSQVIFNDESSLSIADKIKKEIIERLLEKFTDEKKSIKLYPSDEIKEHHKNDKITPYSNENRIQHNWGFILETKEEYYQKSSIVFNTQAQIKTKNGEFNIDISFSFTQEFHQVQSSRIAIGNINLEDPIIINYNDDINGFDNISPRLYFTFDINGDGYKETLPLLKNGAGFLVLDENKNGIIDSGKELFGPQTGNGFKELKEHDNDKNNWLDENDEIFHNLRIWEKNEKGDNNLISLSQAGIGTIYLGSIKTDFNYHKSIEDKTAQLKESSFYVKENGKAGLVTSVDFVV